MKTAVGGGTGGVITSGPPPGKIKYMSNFSFHFRNFMLSPISCKSIWQYLADFDKKGTDVCLTSDCSNRVLKGFLVRAGPIFQVPILLSEKCDYAKDLSSGFVGVCEALSIK